MKQEQNSHKPQDSNTKRRHAGAVEETIASEIEHDDRFNSFLDAEDRYRNGGY